MQLTQIQIEALKRLIGYCFDEEYRSYHEQDCPADHIFSAIDCLDTALIEAGCAMYR